LALLPLPARIGRLVLPMKTAPAARRRLTTGASVSGISEMPPVMGEVSGQPDVVAIAFTSSESLMTIGTPSSGPMSFLDFLRRSSEAAASARASGFIWVKAL
jgi:hypothetical protein